MRASPLRPAGRRIGIQKITDTYRRNLKGSEKLREVFADERLFLKVSLRKDGRTKKKDVWVAGHTLRQRERLGTVIRIFGDKDVNDVSMDDVISAIAQKTRAGNYESARRTLSLIRQALEYAETLGRLLDNRILRQATRQNRKFLWFLQRFVLICRRWSLLQAASVI